MQSKKFHFYIKSFRNTGIYYYWFSIIYNIYHSGWFRDVVNYKKQKPLVISDEEFNQVPEQHRHLFEWSRKE